MRHLTKHLNVVAYVLATLMLFQSCVVYRNQNYSAKEASEYDNKHIKVTTLDGKKYVFTWIEERDGNLISMKNTKVEYLRKSEIEHVILNNPFTHTTLEEALNQDGPVFIQTKNFKMKNKMYDYEFLRMWDRGDRVRGITRTDTEIETVILPIETIREIKVQNKEASTVATSGTVVGVALLIAIAYGMGEMSKGGWFSQ